MTYERLADKLTEYLFKGIEQREYYETIRYGMELLLSTACNLILTVMIAIVLHIELETIVYCLFFIPYRLFSGGAHASTHTRCFLTFTLSQLASILLSRLLADTVLIKVILILSYGFSLCICCFFATGTKHLEEEKKQLHKLVSIAILLLDGVVITCVGIFWEHYMSYLFIASMAITIQSIALLPIRKEKGEHDYE
ncbi:MAG: accessory gene regulator B family protein [bacterium]|nr:accessory gene regulator B family protein [bacterium]